MFPLSHLLFEFDKPDGVEEPYRGTVLT